MCSVHVSWRHLSCCRAVADIVSIRVLDLSGRCCHLFTVFAGEKYFLDCDGSGGVGL